MQEKTPPGVSRKALEGQKGLQEVPPRVSRDPQRGLEPPRELPQRSPKGHSKRSTIPRELRTSPKVFKQPHRRSQRARSAPRFAQFCTEILIKMIGSFEAEKLRQKRQTSKRSKSYFARKAKKRANP